MTARHDDDTGSTHYVLPEPTSEELSRRKMLGRVTHAVGAGVTAAIAAGPVAVALHPLLADDGSGDAGGGWTPVGAVDRFDEGASPERVVLKEDRVDGWLHQKGVPVGSILVQRTEGEDFRVFSAVCPHLGCAVSYAAAKQSYLCPCHRSAFTEAGELLPKEDGEPNPAPRGLDPLEWKVEGGRLLVKWVRFKTGIEAREPVA